MRWDECTARQLIRLRNQMLGLPIMRMGVATIPWGYETDPDKEGWLRPIDKQLRALYYAKILRNRSRHDKLCQWIYEQTGKHITRRTLRHIFYNRPPVADVLLTLDERIQIATCSTEEAAIQLSPQKAQWEYRNKVSERSQQAREQYKRRREAAVARREAEQLQREKSFIQSQSRPSN